MNDTDGKVNRAAKVSNDLERITSANSAARSKSRGASEPRDEEEEIKFAFGQRVKTAAK